MLQSRCNRPVRCSSLRAAQRVPLRLCRSSSSSNPSASELLDVTRRLLDQQDQLIALQKQLITQHATLVQFVSANEGQKSSNTGLEAQPSRAPLPSVPIEIKSPAAEKEQAEEVMEVIRGAGPREKDYQYVAALPNTMVSAWEQAQKKASDEAKFRAQWIKEQQTKTEKGKEDTPESQTKVTPGLSSQTLPSDFNRPGSGINLDIKEIAGSGLPSWGQAQKRDAEDAKFRSDWMKEQQKLKKQKEEKGN